MATARTSFIGNYLKIGKTNPTVGTQTGEFALVLERLVNESKPGENRTTLAIFRTQKDIDAFAKGLKDLDPATNSYMGVAKSKARLVVDLANNSRLSGIFGAGDAWAKLFTATTKRVDPALLGSGRKDPLIDTTFDGEVPVLSSGEVTWKSGTWKINVGDTPGRYKVTATIGTEKFDAILSPSSLSKLMKTPTVNMVPPAAAINTDLPIDISDYGHTLHFWQGFHKCTGGAVSARAILKVMSATGSLLAQDVTVPDAKEAALRRRTRQVLDLWESWLEAAMGRGELYEIPKTEADAVIELKKLGEKAMSNGYFAPTPTPTSKPTSAPTSVPAASGASKTAGAAAMPRVANLGWSELSHPGGGAYIDAVAEIANLIALDPVAAADAATTPLFRMGSCGVERTAMSTRQLDVITKMLVSSIGENTAQFGTHSYRIGGATALFAAGADQTVIRTMGRWSSDCYRLYVRACFGQTLEWSRRCGSQEVSDVAAEYEEVDSY